MSDNRSPDDADRPLPVARGELDDIETLELGRDAAGRLTWQNIAPPGQDTYRAWLPRRGKGTPPPSLDAMADVWADDPVASLFASEATSSATRKAEQPLEEPTAAVLKDWAEPSTEPPTEFDVEAPTARIPPPRSGPPATTGVRQTTITAPVGQHTSTSTPFWSTAVAGPLRLSLAITPMAGRQPMPISLPPARLARTGVERLALLGTGALIGVMASMAFGVVWRPDERPASAAPERPAPTALAVAPVPVPLATPEVPGAQLATADVPETRPAATDIEPVPTTPPVQVAAAAAPSRRAVSPARLPAPASGATVTATRPAASSAPMTTPPEVLATVGRFAAAYNRMDASATQAVWPAADRQSLVTTFTALREQRLTLSRCRGTMNGDTATVMCRGTLRYRPRVGNHDTRILEGNWRFTMLQRADDWVVEGVEPP